MTALDGACNRLARPRLPPEALRGASKGDSMPRMGEDADQPPAERRLTVPEAARALGISTEAVRNRLSRGSLRSVKEGGTVYVLIDRDMARHIGDVSDDRPGESTALISEMRGRIEDLREQLEAERRANEENRRIIAALTSRIPPAIEAPREPPGGHGTAAETSEGSERRPAAEGAQEGAERRSGWWRRLFGG